jgi:hypothetical protein
MPLSYRGYKNCGITEKSHAPSGPALRLWPLASAMRTYGIRPLGNIFPPSHSAIGPVSKKTSQRSFSSAVHRGGGGDRRERRTKRNPSPQGQQPYRDRQLARLAPRIPTTRLPKFAAVYIYKDPAHHHFCHRNPSSFFAQRPCLPSRAPSSPAPPPAAPPPAAWRWPQRSPGPPRTPPLPPRPRLPVRPRGRAQARRRPSRPASRAASSAATAPPPAPRRLRPPSSSAGLPQPVWFATTWAGLLVKSSHRVWVAPSDDVSVSACFFSPLCSDQELVR